MNPTLGYEARNVSVTKLGIFLAFLFTAKMVSK
jgi:hypothetical protein